METKKRKPGTRTVAGKLLKVRENTHRTLKIVSAERGQTIGDLLDDFATSLRKK